MTLQADIGGPQGLTPLHLAALLDDGGACTRCLCSADTSMEDAWDSVRTEDGKTPQDFAMRMHPSALSDPASSSMAGQQSHLSLAPMCRAALPIVHAHPTKKQRIWSGRSIRPVQPTAASSGGQLPQAAIDRSSSGQASFSAGCCCSRQTEPSEKAWEACPAGGQVKRDASNASYWQQSDEDEVAAWGFPHAAWSVSEIKPRRVWQLQSQVGMAQSQDAASSEDESLAATHEEVVCSDSEHSSARDASEL